jgi:hypothetical protein
LFNEFENKAAIGILKFANRFGDKGDVEEFVTGRSNTLASIDLHNASKSFLESSAEKLPDVIDLTRAFNFADMTGI